MLEGVDVCEGMDTTVDVPTSRPLEYVSILGTGHSSMEKAMPIAMQQSWV